MKICVFCASSEDLDEKYYNEAEKTGTLIGNAGHHIIYGAGKIGIMGRLAENVRSAGGKTFGVIPERLNIEGVVSDKDSELIKTPDMKERKAWMRNNADAFLCLPGGFGTLEELMEIITLKQLQYHNKAIVILNTDGFFNKLIDVFKQLFDENFANPSYRSLYTIVDSAEEAIYALENYKHTHIYDKYLKS